MSNWNEVSATIIKSEVVPVVGYAGKYQKDPNIGSGYRLNVIYKYKIENIDYKSNKIFRGSVPIPVYLTEPRANRALRRYPTGSSVSVFIDPDDPNNSTLFTSRKFSLGAWVSFYIIISILTSVFSLVIFSNLGFINIRDTFEKTLEINKLNK